MQLPLIFCIKYAKDLVIDKMLAAGLMSFINYSSPGYIINRVAGIANIMINSIFFRIISSWEVIAAIVAFMIILPVTLYIASHDKGVTLEFVGIRKKKKKVKKKEGNEEEKQENNQEESAKKRTNKPGRGRKNQEENDEKSSENNDRKRYELLKRLKASKGKK